MEACLDGGYDRDVALLGYFFFPGWKGYLTQNGENVVIFVLRYDFF